MNDFKGSAVKKDGQVCKMYCLTRDNLKRLARFFGGPAITERCVTHKSKQLYSVM